MVNTLLQSVDFIRQDGKPAEGLVSVPQNDNVPPKNLSIDEQAVIFEAKLFKHIDFVFFRRFSDEKRSSQVAAYVVDNSDNRLNENALSELHRQVWLQGVVPLLYIAWPSRIDILSCAREPDFWDEKNQKCKYKPAWSPQNDLLTTAAKISEELKKFSAFRLADGTFWDDPNNSKLVNHNKAAHQSLIQAVVDADKELKGEKNALLRRMLLLMVLIKYLEDRDVFPEDWFEKYHKGAKKFLDVLEAGEPDSVNRLLNALSIKFNGDVFDISQFHQLDKNNLKIFANLVGKKMIAKQRYLWEQFSFGYLPVEIISHLYQRFVKGGHGAVYTPPFLAALLLDHVMPYNKIKGNERILDPACGSGVFLVGAFKRLINFYKSKNKWQPLTVNKLKQILNQSIYGIDLDSNAIDLTAFSLSLAICDALKPEVIWKKLKFDKLRDSKLKEADFFTLLDESQHGSNNILSKKFNIVIGNPPFESKLTKTAKKIDEKMQQENPNRDKCPDNQIAYLFLEQSLNILVPKKGLVCMIQLSGLLYNRNPYQFRTSLFQKCCVDTILDFTSIRKMYEADKQTIAVFAKNIDPSEENLITHLTFRRTVSVQERICFELDYYDHHNVSQKLAETDFYIWRFNLLGGGRLGDISKRFLSSQMRTLAKYAKQKKWRFKEGFIVGTKGKPSSFLKNVDYLPSDGLTESGIDHNKIRKLKALTFIRPRRKENYVPPLVLIRKIESLPIGYWEKSFLSYSHEIIGLKSPPEQAPDLIKTYDFLRKNNVFYRFMITLHGSCALTERETAILKGDVESLPYPENAKELVLSFWEQILAEDTLEYMAKYIRLGQNSLLLQKEAGGKELNNYSNTFVKMLGSIYDNLKAGKPKFLNGLICQPFYFGDSPEFSWLNDNNAEVELQKIIYNENHAHLRTVRLLRFYGKNVLLIIKPDRLRYWIRSTAIKDADETLKDLYQQGY
jgi:type I restriction-modification system DNA methylase subunit